jgi:hypothetical protein
MRASFARAGRLGQGEAVRRVARLRTAQRREAEKISLSVALGILRDQDLPRLIL